MAQFCAQEISRQEMTRFTSSLIQNHGRKHKSQKNRSGDLQKKSGSTGRPLDPSCPYLVQESCFSQLCTFMCLAKKREKTAWCQGIVCPGKLLYHAASCLMLLLFGTAWEEKWENWCKKRIRQYVIQASPPDLLLPRQSVTSIACKAT